MYPATANIFNDPMIKIATFDLLDWIDLQRKIFFFPDIGPVTPQLDLAGYDTIYFSLNLGTLFFIIVVYLIAVTIGGLLYIALQYSKALQKIKLKLSEINLTNISIRFIIEGYFEFMLSLAINIKFFEFSQGEFAVTGVQISNVGAIAFVFICFGLPLFIIGFYTYRIEMWTNESFQKKFGSTIEGLDTKPHPIKKGFNKTWILGFPTILVMRRFLFILAVVWQPSFLMLHFFILFAFSTTSIIYLLTFWPFANDRATLLEVFNELCCFMLLYHLLCFTDFVPDAQLRYYLGYSYVFFSAGCIIVHILFIIKDKQKV